MEERKINWKMLGQIDNSQDLLILSSYGYATEMLAFIVAKIRRIPYLLAVDGAYCHKENVIKYLYKRFLIKGARRYLSPGEVTDTYFQNYGVDKKKISRYPFTSLRKVDLETSLVSDDERKKLKDELNIPFDKIVISVGRFDYPNGHRKGFDVLLRAFSRLQHEYGLYMIGGKPTSEYIELAKELRLTNVQFVDFKTKKELDKYYKASDVFCLATRDDIWGLVINEAMAKGLPVVTTDKCVAGLELVENGVNGYIAQSENDIQIAECLNNILSDDALREKMAMESLNTISSYTIENMTEIFYEIIKKSASE
jgi:glycosyltransferase involved in cell wall biosynthesis